MGWGVLQAGCRKAPIYLLSHEILGSPIALKVQGEGDTVVQLKYIFISYRNLILVMAVKEKKEPDKKECYDCWRRRFRREMTEKATASGSDMAKELNLLITKREEDLESVREKFTSLRDEIQELRLLAGDHFMDRYVDTEEDERGRR